VITPQESHLMPLPTKGHPALGLFVSLVIAVSFLSACLLPTTGAQAQEANAFEGTTDSPVSEAAPENSVPPAQMPLAAEEPSPTGAEVPVTAEQTPPVVEQAPPPVEEAPSAPEEANAPPEQTESPVEPEQSPPVAEAPPPTPEQAPPVVEPTPPAVEETPSSSEAAPPVQEQKTTEQPSKTSGESNPGEEAAGGAGDSPTPTGPSEPDRRESTSEVAPASSTAATTPDVAMTVPGTSTVTAVVPAAKNQASVLLGPLTPVTRQPQQASRGLTCRALMFGTGYVDRWLDTPMASLVSTAAGSSPATINASRARDRGKEDGVTVENHPFTPLSGSGGTGSGSAAGGGSGAPSSASFVLVGTLLQTAPNVMRRLCLSQPSWRTTFFALIPERPD
jgi:hypothetical protein